MKKFVLAPALAALAMFFWGFLYWGAPHHLPYQALGHLPDEAATAEALARIFPATGAYLIPNPTAGDEKMAAQMKKGPTAEVHIIKESMTAMDPAGLFKGYLHGFTLALLLAIMLNGLEKSFKGWTCRAKFGAAIGLLVAVGDYGDAIWWHHSWTWVSAQALYDFGAYGIAGLVLAKFLTAKPATPAS